MSAIIEELKYQLTANNIHYYTIDDGLELVKIISQDNPNKELASCAYGTMSFNGREVPISSGYPDYIECWLNPDYDSKCPETYPIPMTIDEIVFATKNLLDSSEIS